MSQPTREAFLRFSKHVARIVTDALAPISPQNASYGKRGYFCTAWRINGREARELFIELPGAAEYAERLRVGLYFRDSARATKQPSIREPLVRQLVDETDELPYLGLKLTSSARGWDVREFPWTNAGIRKWLSAPGPKDVVRLWNLRKGLPSPEQPAAVLRVLAPLWRDLNALGTWSSVEAVDEGARRQIVRELALRDPSLPRKARRRYGTACVVCGFEFERVYGSLGRGFIEVHHKKAIAAGERTNRIQDVTCVCANCHRMLHRGGTILPIGRLKRIVASQRTRAR